MEPEKRLFLNVIIQIIEDYVVDIPVGANKEEAQLAKLQAIAWFKGNSADYKEVCDNAGINANWLRKNVLSARPEDLQKLLHEYRQLYRESTKWNH